MATIKGTGGKDNLKGTKQADDVYGLAGDDVIDGDNGNDVIDGGDGHDFLLGGQGSDTLLGGNGDDTLNGGAGGDMLTGGAGKDIFRFSLDSNALQMDTITDFATGLDKIDLQGLLGTGRNFAWGDQTAIAYGVWFRHVDGNTYVYADLDGKSRTGEMVIRLNGLHDLTNTDFLGVANTAPLANTDTNAITEDHPSNPVSGNVLTNDGDADSGAVLHVSDPGTYVGTYGTLILSADGSYVYTLHNGQSNVQSLAQGQIVHDVFSYTAGDGAASAVSTLEIEITGANDAPVALADDAIATEHQVITVDVLANDADADEGRALTLISASAPDGKGSVSIAGDQIVFDPGNDFDHLAQGATEAVTVEYGIRDEHGATSFASVTVTVTGINDAPVAVADIVTGTENHTLAIDVLANDTDVDDNHQFTLVAAGAPPQKGAVSILDNLLVFEPGTDFDYLAQGHTEEVTLSYEMRDEFGAVSSSTVTLTIAGANDAPTAIADDAAGMANEIITVDVLANDADPDDHHMLTLSAATAPAGKGTVSIMNNRLVFDPGSDFAALLLGTDEEITLGYTIADEFGATAEASVTLTVSGTLNPDTEVDPAAISETIGTDTGRTPTITSGGITADATLLLSGMAEEGSAVGIFDGGNYLGNAVLTGEGWRFLTDVLSDGLHSFTARITDRAGNVAVTDAVMASVDATAPRLVASTPRDNGGAVAVGSNIVLTFNEAVMAGAGNIVISNGAGDTRTIAVNDASQVTVSGNVVTINPVADLASYTNYHVLIDGGTFLDAAGNRHAGISDPASLGFKTALTSLALPGLNGNNGFRVDGPAQTSFGWSVNSAGDFNGDGYDDLIMGAYQAKFGGDFSGSSYVVFGKAGGFAPVFNVSNLNGSNGFRMDGATASQSGWAVSSAGDFNGDGFADLIVGAYNANSGLGSAYVVFGKPSGVSATFNLSSLNGGNGFRVDGVLAGGGAGYSVQSAGDVNGDGFADLVIGANRANSNGELSGSVYVVFGKSSGFDASMALSGLTGANGFRLDGATSDTAGFSVDSAGDINGDGYADLVIGAPSSQQNGVRSGAAYVVFGKAAGFAPDMKLSSLNGANGFRLEGQRDSDSTGYSVSAAGDVNGDGYADLIVGARNANQPSSGSTYVVFGKASGFGAVLNPGALNGSNGFRIDGEKTGSQLGHAVSAAGDVNGDGFDDLFISAPRMDLAGSLSGTCYIVFGKESGFEVGVSLAALDGSNGFRMDGIRRDALTGWSLSSARDVNGDGFGDLVFGSSFAPSYVVFGSSFTNAVTHPGTEGDDFLVGTGGHENFVGGIGNDALIGGGGRDVFYGGAGNDTIAVSGLDFRRVDGGSGVDTLQLAGDGLRLDLAMFRNSISGIEVIDIAGTGDNQLVLGALDLLNLSDTGNTLRVIGDAGDTLHYGTGWTDGGIAGDFHLYSQGQAILLVGVAVSVVA